MNWFKVKDSLPKLGTYLVFNGAVVSSSSYYPPEEYPEMLSKSFKGWTDMDGVTHWAHLPDKPQE